PRGRSGGRRAGQLGEAQHAPDAARGDVMDAVPEPLAVPPQPGPGHIHKQDDDCLRAAAVAPQGMQSCPEGLGGRVQPDDRPLALALAAEQAAALDAGQVPNERAGCKRVTVTKLEGGKQEPAWPRVLRLADALVLSFHEPRGIFSDEDLDRAFAAKRPE